MSDIHVILLIQQASRPILDWAFITLSFLGTEIFYFLALSWVFWCIDRRLGFRLGVVLFVSFFVNFLLKETFQFPRPEHPALRVLEEPEGLAFPSGHAQSVSTFWLFLALRLRQARYLWFALILIGAVSLSRLYLGMHFLQDVLAGVALGTAFAVLFFRLYDWLDREAWTISFSVSAIGSLLVGLFLFAVSPDELSLRIAGSLGGLLFGYACCVRFLAFQCPVNISRRPKYIPGILTVVALHLVLLQMMGNDGWLVWFRYWILNCWIVFGYPLLFLRMQRKGESVVNCE